MWKWATAVKGTAATTTIILHDYIHHSSPRRPTRDREENNIYNTVAAVTVFVLMPPATPSSPSTDHVVVHPHTHPHTHWGCRQISLLLLHPCVRVCAYKNSTYAEKHKNRRIDDSSSRSHRPQRRRARLISCLAACVCVVLSCLSPTPINYNHLRDFKKPSPPLLTVVYFYLSGGGGAFFYYNVRGPFPSTFVSPPTNSSGSGSFGFPENHPRASIWFVETLYHLLAKPKCSDCHTRVR